MKKMKQVSNIVLSALGLFIAFYSYGCKETVSDPNVDANVVTIGNQVWMTKNLDVVTFRNGDTIPEAKTDDEWRRAGIEKQPAWCYYENNTANFQKYGRLYNWYAVKDPRRIEPVGFRVPTDAEWTQMIVFLGGRDSAGTRLKSIIGWKYNGNGNDISKFSAFPGGWRSSTGAFYDIEYRGAFWTSTFFNDINAKYRSMEYDSTSVKDSYTYNGDGLSIRCLRD